MHEGTTTKGPQRSRPLKAALGISKLIKISFKQLRGAAAPGTSPKSTSAARARAPEALFGRPGGTVNPVEREL
eukprot:11292025-Alexandrium_andersonii.AAC.1